MQGGVGLDVLLIKRKFLEVGPKIRELNLKKSYHSIRSYKVLAQSCQEFPLSQRNPRAPLNWALRGSKPHTDRSVNKPLMHEMLPFYSIKQRKTGQNSLDRHQQVGIGKGFNLDLYTCVFLIWTFSFTVAIYFSNNLPCFSCRNMCSRSNVPAEFFDSLLFLVFPVCERITVFEWQSQVKRRKRHHPEMWVNIFPDCSEATGSKALLEKPCRKLCCDKSYTSSVRTEKLRREMLHVVVWQEPECGNGEGQKLFLLLKSSWWGHADFIFYPMTLSTAGVASLFPVGWPSHNLWWKG